MRNTIAALALFSAQALAWDPLAELGITYAWYENDTKTGNIFTDSQSYNGFSGVILRGGVKDFPVYLVGNYEEFAPRMAGQNNGDVEGLSIGLGVRKNFDDFLVFAEAGWTFVDWEQGTDANHKEVTYTYLVNQHGKVGRPIPVDTWNYNWDYELEDAPFFRLGVGWQVFKHLQVNASYKFLAPDQHVAIWDSYRRDNGLGYWREDSPAEFDSAEVTILVTF